MEESNPSFSLEDILGIYVLIQKQRELVLNKRDNSNIQIERLCLTFTSNVLVSTMNKIESLVELRENKNKL